MQRGGAALGALLHNVDSIALHQRLHEPAFAALINFNFFKKGMQDVFVLGIEGVGI